MWSLSIVLPLLLIVFGDENDRNGRPVISHNIAQSEHIPGNVVGNGEASDFAEPDKIEEEMNAADNGAEETREEEESDENTEVSAEPEPGEEGEGMAEEVLQPADDEEESEVTKEARVIDPDKPMVALTFDDGPYRNNTKAIMDLFEQYGGRATFFVVGYHLDVYGEATLEAYQRGFQIGNHTMNHPQLPKLSDEEAMEEIRSLNDKLNALGIEGEVMVRTPYGLPTDYLRENLTVPMIGWNVDSEDWKVGTVDWIYQQLVGKVKDGDIVLLHDLHDVTAEAMQLVVPALVEQGFQLVTVEEMFAAKGIEPQAGEYYCYVR